MAVYDDRDPSHTQYMQTTSLVNYAGAVASLALVAGISVWGYNLIMRDVSGIPIVRAAEGAMRVAPQDAGGEIVDHAGLSVNQVAGEGGTAGPSDSLLLAPQTPALAEEDLRVEPLAEADEVLPAQTRPVERETAVSLDLTTPAADAQAEPLTTEGILALADQIAGTAAPLSELAAGEAVPPTVSLGGEVDGAIETAAAPAVDPSVPGVAVSLRPAERPASLVTLASAEASPVAELIAQPETVQQVADTTTAVAAALAEAQVAASAPIAAGTNLVQLGAYPTAEVAAAEWTRISAQFAEYMSDKERVIQEASSGGSTFYRLRAGGFAEPAAARRFCEALKSGDAECIPVVVR